MPTQIERRDRRRRCSRSAASTSSSTTRASRSRSRCSRPPSRTGTSSTTSWRRARSSSSKAAAQVLIEQGMGGDIVYIASKNSVFAGPNNIAYSATKADQAHQVRLLAVELGEHGIRVNGINPDGVVRGSGIFASGWGANRAKTYGIDGGGPRQVLRPAHDPQARGAARERRQRRLGAHRTRPLAHDRAAHPGRRGRRGRVPAVTAGGHTAAPSPPSTSAPRAAGSCSGTSTESGSDSSRSSRFANGPGAHARRAALEHPRAVPRRRRGPRRRACAPSRNC